MVISLDDSSWYTIVRGYAMFINRIGFVFMLLLLVVVGRTLAKRFFFLKKHINPLRNIKEFKSR